MSESTTSSLRFISGNEHKLAEAQKILASQEFEVIGVKLKINEIQTIEVPDIVIDKCKKAFAKIGRPLFVEHTVLELKVLSGFPGGLTETFWETLKRDRFCELYANTEMVAKTVVGYCDGKTIQQFDGKIEGTVAPEPRGNIDFQWDCVFIPRGYDQTFAELGDKKNDISMRTQAFKKFALHLQKERPCKT